MKTLLLIDLQNDFLPGGALAVPEGDATIAVANALMPEYDLVVATQDWHPAGHASFASQHPGKNVGQTIDLDGLEQILWPDHCIQATHGAAFAPNLNQAGIDHVVCKGTDPRIDSYSGFFDNGHRQSTGLADWLQAKGVQQIDLMGLATDYCVKFTALDAIQSGFSVRLIQAGCRGVNLQPDDVAQALKDMAGAGVVTH